MKNLEDFYKKFKPELSPKKMLEYGVFGGSYLGSTIKEYPESWFKKAKISKYYNINLNYFRVHSGLSLSDWKKKGWIFKEDPRGWYRKLINCGFLDGDLLDLDI